MKRQGRTVCRLCLAAVLAVSLAYQSASPPAWASPVTKAEREKKEAESEYQKTDRQVQELEESKSAAEQQEGTLLEELTSLMSDLDLLKEDLADMEERISQTDQEYREAKASQDQQYQLMKKRIQFLYEEGEITYLDILLKAKSIEDIVNETEYAKQLYEYDKNMILNYETVKEEVLERKETLEEQKSECEAMKQEYTAQKEALEQTIEEKKKAIRDFDQKLEEAKKKADELTEVIREKTERIRVLRLQEEAKRARERAAADAARKRYSGLYKSTGGSEFGRRVADYALQFVGNPYVWGGTSLTNGADCSGFTQSVYRHFGVNIPRTSGEQAQYGREIPYEEMEPGDLICYSGHVSMYIGDGRIVRAASSKAGIKVGDDPAYRTIVSIRRPW